MRNTRKSKWHNLKRKMIGCISVLIVPIIIPLVAAVIGAHATITAAKIDTDSSNQSNLGTEINDSSIGTVNNNYNYYGVLEKIQDEEKTINSKNSVKLSENHCLLGGNNYWEFNGSGLSYLDGETKPTDEAGFIIQNNPDGYVLLDLNGSYTSVTFDVGRLICGVNDSFPNLSVKLKITLDDDVIREIDICDASSPKFIKLEVEHAIRMKIEVISASFVCLGFENVTLWY